MRELTRVEGKKDKNEKNRIAGVSSLRERRSMSAKTLMIQGTGSSVGKSLLVTALCRIFFRRGISVAPFKSQNMSLNSFITDEGLEMGRAQVAQAEAAGLVPSVLMNPVLLKPCGDRRSQVIVRGRARAVMDAKEYHVRRAGLAPEVLSAFTELAARHELILIEGAGSPAEINLRENDIANMGMAELADAPVVLVGDIDRGGVFAALYGTVKLLPPREQKRIRGCVINKFRGDEDILAPGLRQLEALLGIPVLGVLPYMDVRLDEEDSLSERLARHPGAGAARRGREAGLLDIAVTRLPRLSNYTDFAALEAQPDVALRYVREAADLAGPDDEPDPVKPDLVLLPGTKNTLEDMLFVRRSGLADGIVRLHGRGVPVVGLCGGFQLLGRALRDPLGVESGRGAVAGLGLLPMETLFAKDKRTVRTTLLVDGKSAEKGLLRGTAGMRLEGYEIHMGFSSADPEADCTVFGRDGQGEAEGLVNANGTVIGSYLHGFFDNILFTRTLLNNLRAGRNLPPLPLPVHPAEQAYACLREAEYERLADRVEACLNIAALRGIIEEGAGRTGT
jgi:adenosylcobyric acid synthase